VAREPQVTDSWYKVIAHLNVFYGTIVGISTDPDEIIINVINNVLGNIRERFTNDRCFRGAGNENSTAAFVFAYDNRGESI